MLKKPAPKTTKKPVPTVPQNVAARKAASKVEHAGALTKDWIELTKQVMLCSGNYSQAHKRFRGHNQQSAAVCVVACALPTLRKMNTWTKEVLDQILDIGTHLHLKSKQVNDNRCIEHLKPPDIYKYFFLHNLKISMKVGVDTYQERLPRDSYMIKKIEEFMKRFFRNYGSGVFACQNTYFAIWKYDKYYCMFDPTEHSLDGGKWSGLPGLGYAYCIRAPNLKALAEIIAKNCPLKQINKFMIYPCFLEKYIVVNTVPPETLEEVKPIPLEVQETSREHKAHKSVKRYKPPPEPPADKAPDKAAPKPGETPELKEGEQPPASGEIKPKKSVSKSMIPPERPKLRSITNFAEVFGKGGILRASTHQRDPRFTRYMGAQGFANALAALTMLRQHKGRHWIKNILDDVLKLGERIHHDSKKLPPGQIIKKITLDEKEYTPKVDKVAAVGRLESTEENVLNLDETMKNYLLESDCCILKGPHTVAIWKEDDRYYMFDPEERNAAGRPAELGYPGFACVTWYTRPSDLVATYLSNVPKANKKDRFILCKVAIKDYSPLSDDWYNFKALTVNKWILRGNFSQQDRRFPPESRNAQCTANATMALTYKELKQENEWNTDTVDQVLMDGDEFYRSCVEYLQECGRFKDRYLMVDEIKRNFDVENKRVNLEIDDCLVNGIVNARSDTGIPNLRKGFEEFFVESDAGIVTANLQSMAVWKRDNTYFYYDSHSRNEKGVVSGFGTACVLRVVNIDDLTNALTINLGADPQNFYNISRVVVKLFDVTEDGMVKPPLNFYVALNDLVAILRSNTSEKDKKYNISAGKQTVPILLAALAYNDVTPSFEWTREDVDQVLDFGNKMYVESMEANYQEDTPEDQNVDEITTNNVKKNLKIGPNSIELELDEGSTGTIENIQEALEGLQERVAQEGNSAFSAILESEYQTVSIWRDDNLFYLFDSKERDETGNIYGRDEWSVKIVEVEEDEEEGEGEYEDKKEEGDWDENKDEMGGGDNLGEPEEREQAQLNYDEPVADDEEMEEEEEEEPIEKKGSEFWRNKADEEGKACVLRFSKLEDLINHIKENTPPNKREEIEYTLKSVKVKNTPVLNEVFDPEVEDKVDEFAGDWNEFKEIDYGKWILRAIRSFKDALFPECNREKQAIPMCIVALAFSHMYALSKFKQDVVDNILIYGDRLHTVARKLRGKELKANKELGLSEDEIELILSDTQFDVVDYPRKMCMGEKLASWEVTREAVKGDTTSKIPETVHNVLSALTAFFEEHTFGIIECRGYPVAVWKHDGIYYMFDPHPCGPAGVQSPIGEACITRFKELEELSKVYLDNLPKLFGKNMFEIHALTFAKDICKRPRHPEKKEEKAPKIGGFNDVTAGKSILRGDLKLDCTKFDRGVHIHSAPIAYVALALSLNKDPDTWTRIIVNEILRVGEELYNDSIDKLGETYNPWAERLDICRVNPDFNIGSLRVNCAIRFTEQRGVVDIKNSKTLNLRQGIEKFFEENSHGVLVADKFVLPIWEQAKGKDVSIYIFDPNSRGGTGLPSQGGLACVMKFCNAKVASDHIKASMMDIDKTKTRFSIIPIEIVIGTAKTKRKCPLLSDGTQMTASTKRALGATTKLSSMSKPKTYSTLPVTCPTKADISEQKRTLRSIAEDQRARREAKRCAHLGRDGMYEINNNQSVIRGLRSIAKDRELPVNLVAFVFMRLATDINKWSYKQIELVLEAGYQLYVDSFNAYKPEKKKLNLQNVLRRVLLKDFEVKIEIKKPILGGALTRDNLLVHLTNLFNVINFCILSYDEYLVSLYFKGGYYFMFDPYSRDLYGNKADDGFAILMRFGDLSDLVNKIVRNFVNPDDEMKKRYALILVGITSVEPLVM